MKKIIITLAGKVKTGFSQFNANGLLDKARKVIKALTGNATYPTPDPDLVTMQSYVDALQVAQTASENGDRQAIKTREQARQDLMLAMQKLGNYVNFTSGGSLEAAASSGFDLYKTPETYTVQPITRLKIENKPNTNALVVTAVGGKGCKTFVHQYAVAGDKPGELTWINITSTTRKCLIPNLVKNTEYVVQVTGIGAKGQMVISDTVTRIAQ